ncbi:MAG: hypothetical protein KF690_03735 [Bacteroidetes bacterium]|nr:hypothetical protein [Bacteroidota bacterium]
MKKRLLSACVGLLLLMPAGCGVFKDPELPTWNLDLYGPLSLVEVELSDLFSGQVFTYGTGFKVSDFSLPFPLNFPIPGISGYDVPEIDTVISRDFKSLILGSAYLGVSIENNWPINIQAGTVISISNEEDELLVAFTLEQNIAPNGGTYQREVYVENVRYTARLKFQITNLGTDGSGGQVVDFGDKELRFLFSPREMDIVEMTITDNREIPYEESDDFSITSDRVKALGVLGKFYTIFSNPHPFSFSNQSYLLATDSTVLDSLFEGTQLIMGTEGLQASGACPNLQGTVQVPPDDAILQRPVINRDTINLTQTRLENINAAKIVKIRGYICLPPNPDNSGVWTMRKEDVIFLKIIGDINLKMDLK